MAQIMISYKFTGEDIKAIQNLLGIVYEVLTSKGIEYFCNFSFDDHYKDNNYTHGQIMRHCFEELDKTKCLLVLLTSNNKSEGMLMEIGYALAKNKKVIIARHRDVHDTYLHDMDLDLIEWDTLEELRVKLTQEKFDFLLK